MEKEDILLKSKNDNRKGDELQVQNKQNAEMFGYGSVMFVLVILMIMGSELVRGEVQIGSMTMLFEDFITLLVGLSLVCEFGAKFYFTRKWWQLLLALFFALKPGKIIIWIGKFLNPLFLIFLAVLIIAAFINPMGAPSAMPVQSAYQQEALTKGIIEGYNTMDALASLAFGIIVIHTLSDLGLKNPKDIADIFFEFHMKAVDITDEECLKYGISKSEASKITNAIRAFASEMYSQKLRGKLLQFKKDFPKDAMQYNRKVND